jgi:hypothetical protein
MTTKTVNHKAACLCVGCEDRLDAVLRKIVYEHGGYAGKNVSLALEMRLVREALDVS